MTITKQQDEAIYETSNKIASKIANSGTRAKALLKVYHDLREVTYEAILKTIVTIEEAEPKLDPIIKGNTDLMHKVCTDIADNMLRLVQNINN